MKQFSIRPRKLIFILIGLLLSCKAFCQPPQMLSYQAVVRDLSGNPLPNGTNVNFRFLIHDGTATGTVVFLETQLATTNQFGMVSISIGSVSSLAAVNWASGAKFLQVEIDNTGG